ncbi:MAG TPA: methyltransferase domain-containing protein [Stellaceae bacterium]|nr:methyltransferase domain-containing protein [Stellaceae bacterium]
MPADGGAESDKLRRLIRRYYGDGSRILAVRKAMGAGAFLFVVEATLRGRMLRLLGTVGRTREVMEHSAMDLGAPERLVFSYERLMLASLALAAEAKSVLMLGLGGGAMCRHLAAYLPQVAVMAVERDPAVIAYAREHFHIDRRIVRGDAVEFVADAKGAYDSVMVDLYDAGGTAPLDEQFWENCIAALRPGGCVAVNWAGGWTGEGLAGSKRQRVERVKPPLPGSFLVAERGPRGNTVQFAPTAPGFRVSGLAKRLAEFAAEHKLPREDRDVLQRCDVGARYPAGKGK